MKAYHTEAFSNPGYRLNVLVDVTNRCQLDCRYCYYGEKGHADMQMGDSLIAIERLFEAIGKNTPKGVGALHVQMMGGEPLVVKKKMFDLVDACEKSFSGVTNFSWGLTSNLFALDKKTAKKILDRGGRIHASFDGPSDIQNRNRPRLGGKDSSQRVFGNIPNALEVSRFDTARITVGPEDAGRLDEICRFAFEQGYSYVGPFPATNLDWDGEAIERWGESFKSSVLMTLEEFPEKSIRTMIKMTKRKEEKSWAYCGGGRTLFAIDVRGRLHMCHHLTNHEKGIDLAGLSSDEIFDRIINSPVVPKKFGHPENCLICPARYRCNGGGCWAENLSATGHADRPSQINCAIRVKTNEILDNLDTSLQLAVRKWDNPSPAERERARKGLAPWGVETVCDPCDCEDGASFCEGSCVACNTMC